MLVPAVGASGKLVAATVMALAAARFGLTGLYELTGSSGWKHTAGITGLVLAIAAFYAATAFELEATKRRTVLPLLRRGPGQRALDGRLADQLDGVANEAGVRQQL
jgi:hypothetical protein